VIDLVGKHKACLFKPGLLSSIFHTGEGGQNGQGEVVLLENELETLHQMMQELLDYRFAEYRCKKQ